MKQPKTPPQPSFEQSLTELEAIVDALEQGEMTLEDSLAAFERGIGLTRLCQQALEAAEQRVRILTDPRPDAEPEPFDAHD
ncbi:exodeoxyribonuclease VII small subunit [Thermochromatium tepidum]|jgi:Exodeoxyribonuclease VII small subunit (EC 3.1.11.6)|uniref:Exodeoxyribonuclease 7 small subunit n=1 Tax=Thermochromatium tepidum ATCC 43061 TaxID=316276 RepID=A0A6I6EA55_THETI|nr:exodeoxyribonuclease VII small subunit [Thermochromatium tepidum]QGU33583.1 exodeoxyribonuclease VII small subunit [Thermochromatium tepidum ATCC 43061]